MKTSGKVIVTFCFVASICVVGYLSLFFNALLYADTFSFNFGTLMSALWVTGGFPYKLFLFFTLLFVAIGVLLLKIGAGGSLTTKITSNMNYKRSNTDTHGSAHEAEEKEYQDMALLQKPEDAYGTIFGAKEEGKTLLVSNYNMMEGVNNQNVMVIGAAGGGKTTTYVYNYIFQAMRRRESLIITDTKSEIYRTMAAYARANGYIVRTLNLKNFEKSDGWDALSTCIKDNWADDAELFSKTVILNVTSGKNQTDIYTAGPQSLLKALLLRVKLGNDFSNDQPVVAAIEELPTDRSQLGIEVVGRKTMQSVYKLLQHPDGFTFLEEFFSREVLERTGSMGAYGPYMSFKQASPNLLGNLVSNLSIQLQTLQSPIVQQVLSTDDIDLELPGKRPCMYFCLFPDNHDTYKFIVSLFFSMLYIKLSDYADDQPENRLPVPVNFLLDEFPHIGFLPDWEKKLGTSRGRSINISMISQDLPLLQNRYDLLYKSILGNCAVWISVGSNDMDSAKLLSERIGNTTVKTMTESRSGTASILGSSVSTSTGESSRPLMAPDEVFKVERDESLVIFQRKNPVKYKKFIFTKHPDFQKMPRDENGKPIESYIKDLPNFGTEERKAFNEKNLKDADEYLKKYPLPTLDQRKAFYREHCEPYHKKQAFNPKTMNLQSWLNGLADKLDGKESNDDGIASPSNDTNSSPVVEFEDLGRFYVVEDEETLGSEENEALENFSQSQDLTDESLDDTREPEEDDSGAANSDDRSGSDLHNENTSSSSDGNNQEDGDDQSGDQDQPDEKDQTSSEKDGKEDEHGSKEDSGRPSSEEQKNKLNNLVNNGKNNRNRSSKKNKNGKKQDNRQNKTQDHSLNSFSFDKKDVEPKQSS